MVSILSHQWTLPKDFRTKSTLVLQKWHWKMVILTKGITLWKKPSRLAECLKALSLLYRNLYVYEPTKGGKLIEDAHNQRPFEPREWVMRFFL